VSRGRRGAMGEDGCVRFCRCIFTVGPLGALLIQAYKSLPLRASKKRTLLQLYSSGVLLGRHSHLSKWWV
jgi:hypothetical protein